MEGNPVIKVSVAELAGKFKDHSVSSCAGCDGQNKPVRRRPPRTLQIPAKNEEGQGQEQKSDGGSTRPARSRNRNSALIEKLQADLALSPMALGPGPMVSPLKSPGQRLQLPGFPTSPSPRSPVTPPAAVEDKQEMEAPTSFESPADGTLLPSINKGRARLSVRRRPPSRRVKRSGDSEVGDEDGGEDSIHLPTGPAKSEDEESHMSKTQTSETSPAETHTPEADKGEACADDPGVVASETETDGGKETEVADREQAEIKTETEAQSAAESAENAETSENQAATQEASSVEEGQE